MRARTIIVAGVLVVACAAKSTAHADAPAPTPVAEPAPTPANDAAANAARRARVYARVGDTTVTVGQIEDEIAKQPRFRRARFRERATLLELANQLLERELLSREAVRRGLADRSEARMSIDQMAVQHFLRAEIDDRITPESIPDTDVRAYYDQHSEEFSRPEMIRASHVLVADRATAQRLVTEARAADMRGFRELARRSTSCSSRTTQEMSCSPPKHSAAAS
jgi:peptidyl-prolyl cis-trans isomerase C